MRKFTGQINGDEIKKLRLGREDAPISIKTTPLVNVEIETDDATIISKILARPELKEEV